MVRTGRLRYICSFVLKNKAGRLVPNVVVITATNDLMARAQLCSQYGVPNVAIKDNFDKEGIKKIRLSDTNRYEGEPEGDDFSQDFEIRT
jgi:hypothetical protein